MTSRLQALSLTALRTVALGAVGDPAIVAQRLYRFGAMPRQAAMERDFGPEDDPMGVLGLTMGGAARRRLDGDYVPSAITGWYSFARLPLRERVPVAKLYVSPQPAAMARVFPRAVDVLAGAGVRSFKVGRGIEGLLRPDKLVAYFDDRAHLDAVARDIVRRLGRVPVQGTPFTCDAGGDGLVSWGIDPPASDGPASWRAWITTRMAEAFAQHSHLDRDARVAAVLGALAVDGVDTHFWRPAPAAFTRETAA